MNIYNGLLQERLKKEQEEKEHKKKEKAEAHLYTIIKVLVPNLDTFEINSVVLYLLVYKDVELSNQIVSNCY